MTLFSDNRNVRFTPDMNPEEKIHSKKTGIHQMLPE